MLVFFVMVRGLVYNVGMVFIGHVRQESLFIEGNLAKEGEQRT